MKIYVSGPMSGKPEFNKAAFEEAATVLKQLGHHPVTPFDLDVVEPVKFHDWTENMKRDIKYLPSFDAVLLMDDWDESKGATIEAGIAQVLSIPLFKFDDEGFLMPANITVEFDVFELSQADMLGDNPENY